jgi:hypothetical protein
VSIVAAMMQSRVRTVRTPRALGSQDGVGDADQLAHDGEALGLSCLDQALVKVAQRWIVLDHREAGNEQQRADLRPA